VICAGCAAAADDPQRNLAADEYVHADVREYSHRRDCTGRCDCQHRVRVVTAAPAEDVVVKPSEGSSDRG